MALDDAAKRKWIRKLRIRNQALREFMAEFLGTFILVAFGIGAGCQSTLGGLDTDQLTAHLAGGMGVMLAITVSGGVSGGGVNPAVSLAFCLSNRTPWILYPVHVIGQMMGAFVAAGVMFYVYKDAIDDFDKGVRSVEGVTGTAAMFTSFPQDYLSTQNGFLDQVVSTAILILMIHAILDKYNMDPPKGLKPLLVGLCVFAIGGSLGLNCGYPLNPARDLGPRLFLLAAGWGNEVFSFKGYNWFWVPIAGPLTGSLVGSLVYYLFVGWHWAEETISGDCTFVEDTNPTGTKQFNTQTNGSQKIADSSHGKGVMNLGFTGSDTPCRLTAF